MTQEIHGHIEGEFTGYDDGAVSRCAGPATSESCSYLLIPAMVTDISWAYFCDSMGMRTLSCLVSDVSRADSPKLR